METIEVKSEVELLSKGDVHNLYIVRVSVPKGPLSPNTYTVQLTLHNPTTQEPLEITSAAISAQQVQVNTVIPKLDNNIITNHGFSYYMARGTMMVKFSFEGEPAYYGVVGFVSATN